MNRRGSSLYRGGVGTYRCESGVHVSVRARTVGSFSSVAIEGRNLHLLWYGDACGFSVSGGAGMYRRGSSLYRGGLGTYRCESGVHVSRFSVSGGAGMNRRGSSLYGGGLGTYRCEFGVQVSGFSVSGGAGVNRRGSSLYRGGVGIYRCESGVHVSGRARTVRSFSSVAIGERASSDTGVRIELGVVDAVVKSAIGSSESLVTRRQSGGIGP